MSTGEDAFVRYCARVAVVQVCRDLGFHALRGHAVDVLTDILLRFVGEVGRGASGEAELAGRTECNFLDVRAALGDVAGMQVGELARFIVEDEGGGPGNLLRQVPVFPVPRKDAGRKRWRSWTDAEGEGAGPGMERPARIPAHLPVFPDAHTYKETPDFEARRKKEREGLALGEAYEARMGALRAMSNLMARLPEGDFLIPPEENDGQYQHPGEAFKRTILPDEEAGHSELRAGEGDGKEWPAFGGAEKPEVPKPRAGTALAYFRELRDALLKGPGVEGGKFVEPEAAGGRPRSLDMPDEIMPSEMRGDPGVMFHGDGMEIPYPGLIEDPPMPTEAEVMAALDPTDGPQYGGVGSVFESEKVAERNRAREIFAQAYAQQRGEGGAGLD